MFGNWTNGNASRCSHRLRTSVPGKSRICLVCKCAELDELLSTECSGNKRLPCAYIDNIIHVFRIINSTLDAPTQTNLDEILTQILKTSLGLLKIHREDIGVVVSQTLEKIYAKAPITLLEYFLEDLSAQILDKPSFGNLESLSGLIRRKECLNNFLKRHSSTVHPKLFQELEEHAANIMKHLACTALPISTTKTTRETGALVSMHILGKILDVLETTCGTDVIVTHHEDQTSNFLSSEATKSLIITCMEFLKSFVLLGTHPDLVTTATKMLRFLSRLQENPETLRCIFCDKTGTVFCSLVKDLLLTRSSDELHTATLAMVLRMVTTYRSVMEDNKMDKEFIANMPSVILEVDLVGFIKDAINTTNETLFITTIKVLDQIISIPAFKQMTVPVLESTLRTSAMIVSDFTDTDTFESLHKLILSSLEKMNIPPTIQRQLIYLFERLPEEWSTIEILPWIKLLVYCSDVGVQQNILSIFTRFVKSHDHNITSIKCVLLLASILISNRTGIESSHAYIHTEGEDSLAKQLMHCLMDDCFLPSVITLVRYGKSEDSDYIAILLELLLNYPTQHLVSPTEIRKYSTSLTCKVEFDNLTDHEISLDTDWFMKKHNDETCWPPSLLMQVMGEIRNRMNRCLFKVWNQHVANIMCVSYPTHLPQFMAMLGKPTNERQTVESILEGLHLEAIEWEMNHMSRVATLAYYFFLARFTGKNTCNFINENFVERFCNFLEGCQKEPGSDFYFRVALMIASSLPYQEAFGGVFQNFLQGVDDNIMIYHYSVFTYLLHQMPSNYTQLIEKWIKNDKQAVIDFYCRDHDYEMKTEITNTLIILAAHGNAETSRLAATLGTSIQPSNFQLNTVLFNFHNIFSRLGTDEATLHQLPNLIKLILNDDLLLSEQSFPLGFITKLIKILMKHPTKTKGLELLCKIFKYNGTNNPLRYKEFIKYLGSKINGELTEMIHAQSLLSQFIRNGVFSDSPPLITWKLSSVMSYIQRVPRYEILEFLLTILKIDFNCPIIKIEELDSPKILKEVLLNLLFNLEALTHKVTIPSWIETIWEILNELLRVAEANSFLNDVLLQPWIKVLVVRLVSNCKIPADAPLMSLEFLQKWTKMMLNELKNPNRSPFHTKFVAQYYFYTFKTIQDAMEKRPLQDASERNLTVRPFEEGNDIELNIDKKTALICQTAKNCEFFFSNLVNT